MSFEVENFASTIPLEGDSVGSLLVAGGSPAAELHAFVTMVASVIQNSYFEFGLK